MRWLALLLALSGCADPMFPAVRPGEVTWRFLPADQVAAACYSRSAVACAFPAHTPCQITTAVPDRLDPELVAVLVHEIWHCQGGHHSGERAEGK
jgi:hypothetical protein